jgi:hypothetical protein
MDDPHGGRTSARDAALARARRVKRWVAGGAVALTGVFSAVAAHALPASHSSKKATPAPAAPAPTAAPPVDPGASDDQQQPVTPISPPQQAPQPSAGGGGAVSGGS